MKIGLITGGFDPIHSGHIQMIEEALEKSDVLYVGVNSDRWLQRKKGYFLIPLQERIDIIRSILSVSWKNRRVNRDVAVFQFQDDDDTAKDALNIVTRVYDTHIHEVTFYNGGDRTSDNIPEKALANALKVRLEFGCGGATKKASSSDFVKNLLSQLDNSDKSVVSVGETERNWGRYSVLYTDDNYKIKKLIVAPGKNLSLQRHYNRHEYWVVLSGIGKVELGRLQNEEENWGKISSNEPNAFYYLSTKYLTRNESVVISAYDWHRLYNIGTIPLEIIELQLGVNGKIPEEEDIERMVDSSKAT